MYSAQVLKLKLCCTWIINLKKKKLLRDLGLTLLHTHVTLLEPTVSHCKPRPFRDGPSKVSGCLGVQEESFQHHPEESAEQKEMQHDGHGGACMLYNNKKLKAQFFFMKTE